ncbi:hypothetical protein H0H93_010245 [Arthromyces matolae]|nr:hypothetical protein H0H93_010245 [Arthromyces matolae]
MPTWPTDENAQWWMPVGNGKWRCLACKDAVGIERATRAAKRHEQSKDHQYFVDAASQSFDRMEMGEATAMGVQILLKDMASSPSPGSKTPPPDDSVQLAHELLEFLSDQALSDEEEAEIFQSDDESEEGNVNTDRGAFAVASSHERQLDILLWLLRINGIEGVPSVQSVKQMNKKLQHRTGVRTLSYNGALGHKYSCNSLSDIIAQEFSNPKVRPHLRFYAQDNGKSVNEYFEASHWREPVPANDDRQIKLTPMADIRGQHYYLYEPCVLRNGSFGIPYEWFQRKGKLFSKIWPMTSTLAPPDSDPGWIVNEHLSYEISEDDFLLPFTDWTSSPITASYPQPSQIIGSRITESGPLRPWMRTDPRIGNRWRAKAQGARVYSFPMWLYCDDTSGNSSKKWNKHNSFLFTPAGLPREYVHQEYNIHFLCTSNIAPPLEMLGGIVDQLENSWENGIWAYDCVHKEFVLVIPSVVALLGDNPMQSELSCHVGLMVKGFDTADGNQPNPVVADSPQVAEHHPSADDSDADSPAEHRNGAADSRGARSRANSETTTNSGASDARLDLRQGNGKTGKKKESLNAMFQRVTRFLTRAEPRTKKETTAHLGTILRDARIVGNQTKIKMYKTNTGVKDNFLEHFIDRMQSSYSKITGYLRKQQALDDFITNLPEDPFSPVWRIPGLDPHCDTPVEILHVILLGFVKYFWRDAVTNQVKKNTPQYGILIARLSSFDVSGLNITKLSGQTLVQYAGSLTGRDFRAIAQAAPFVLHGLVPDKCYSAWAALANLIPLVWQPTIGDIDSHLKTLETAIDEFLLRVAHWTPRWFNKPKFHIFLHLPTHIRRFGPAILFATEGFESFNAVIRAKSVHSNRQAPSRDIALGFAQGSRIRHYMSGGYILTRKNDPLENTTVAGDNIESSTVGWGPLSIISRPSIITDYLGHRFPDNSRGMYLGSESIPILTVQVGRCKQGQSSPVPYASTSLGMAFSEEVFLEVMQAVSGVDSASSSLKPLALQIQICESATLYNGDICKPGSWVLACAQDGSKFICRVQEIAQIEGSRNYFSSHPDIFLVQLTTNRGFVDPYEMPGIVLDNRHDLVTLSSLICTVNVQHHCAANACQTSQSTFIRQEREFTSQTQQTVSHGTNPHHMVLNTAQMRDSAHLGVFRRRAVLSTSTEVESILLEATASEIDARRNMAALTTAAARSRGRGRGRGRGSAFQAQMQPQVTGGHGTGRGRLDIGA